MPRWMLLSSPHSGRRSVELVHRVQGISNDRRKDWSDKSQEVALREHRHRASLDDHLCGCIIQRTYGFGLAPLLRGKLFEGQEGEQRQGERLRELAECALVHRSNFADEPLRIE